MRARNPGEARVIFISGYAARDFARTLDEDREGMVLPKPFTLKQLAEMVKRRWPESRAWRLR